jgi:hypothetical protein
MSVSSVHFDREDRLGRIVLASAPYNFVSAQYNADLIAAVHEASEHHSWICSRQDANRLLLNQIYRIQDVLLRSAAAHRPCSVGAWLIVPAGSAHQVEPRDRRRRWVMQLMQMAGKGHGRSFGRVCLDLTCDGFGQRVAEVMAWPRRMYLIGETRWE